LPISIDHTNSPLALIAIFIYHPIMTRGAIKLIFTLGAILAAALSAVLFYFFPTHPYLNIIAASFLGFIFVAVVV